MTPVVANQRSSRLGTTAWIVMAFAFVALLVAAPVLLGRPITGAPLDEQAIARGPFSAEIKAADNMDDHGWLYVEVRTSFDGNPQQLCDQFMAAIYRQIHWALPGVGLAVYPDLDATPGPHHALAQCPTFPFGLGSEGEGR